jgi:hypothetical protein
MRIKKYSLLVVTLFFLQAIKAQSQKTNDYFITKKDTIFCTELTYTTTARGVLKSIKYTNLNGQKIEIKKNLPDVQTFYLFGSSYDKIPFKANKPDGPRKYTHRIVDGTLKVYLAEQTTSSSGNVSGVYRFFIKFPDGTFYKINKRKNLNNVIKPYLLKCLAFKSSYKGDFSTRQNPFIETIKFYNSVCK